MPDVNVAKISEILYKSEIPKYLQLKNESEELEYEAASYEAFCLGSCQNIISTSRKRIQSMYYLQIPSIPEITLYNYYEVIETFEANCIRAFTERYGTESFTKKEEELLLLKMRQLEKNFPVIIPNKNDKNPYMLFCELISKLKRKLYSLFSGALVEIKERKERVKIEVKEKKEYIDTLILKIPEQEIFILWTMQDLAPLMRKLQDIVCEYISSVEGRRIQRANLYYATVTV